MVVTQYPHFLYVRCSEPATRAENGDFIPGRSSLLFLTRCREETNGAGQEIITADQRTYKFASTIYMPQGTQPVPEGTQVVVSGTELKCEACCDECQRCQKAGIRITGECRKFDPGQLHARLWL